MNEWRRRRGAGGRGSVAGPLKGDRGRPCVCQYALWACPVLKLAEMMGKSVRQTNSRLELFGTAFQGVAREEGGWNNTQGPTPSSLIFTCHPLGGQTCKKIYIYLKKHQSAQNGLNFNYSVVYTCDKIKRYQSANVWELHLLLMVFFIINKYVHKHGDKHKVYSGLWYIDETGECLNMDQGEDQRE